MADMILSELNEGVLLLKLNRGPRNAFTDDYFKALHKTFDQANANPDVRCVVLSSNIAKFFCAGLDLANIGLGNRHEERSRNAFLIREHLLMLQRAVSSIEECRVPVIAALSGIVLGAGVDIASACDIRLASSDAIFNIKEVDVGLAADIGSLQRFPKAVGNNSKARELVYTARNFDAQEAYEIGFLSQVVQGRLDQVQAEALKLARTIAAKSPVAVTSSKHLLNYSRDHSVQEGLDYTAAWNAAHLQAEDISEAASSFLQKRKPSYKPLSKL